MSIEDKLNKPNSGLRNVLGKTLLYATMIGGALGILAPRASAQQTAKVEFFDGNGKPVVFIVPETGSNVPVPSFSCDFSNGTAQKFSLINVDNSIHTGYIKITDSSGNASYIAQYAVGTVSGFVYNTDMDLMETSTGGVTGLGTYTYTASGQVFSVGVLAATPTKSFEIPIKNDQANGLLTALAFVNTSKNPSNYRFTLAKPNGTVIDQFYTTLPAMGQAALYPFTMTSKQLDVYDTLHVDCEYDCAPMTLTQTYNSFSATPVNTTPSGTSSGPSLKLVDFFVGGTNIGSVKPSDMPPVTNATVTYTNLSTRTSTVFQVNSDGNVGFIPNGSSTPVFLPSGTYERVITAPGFVTEHRNVTMPDTTEIAPIMDNVRFNVNLEAAQWVGNGTGINFFTATDQVWQCYFNTTGLDMSTSINKVIRDGFKHWVNYILPQQGISTKYIENNNTPIPTNHDATTIPDYTFVVYRSNKTDSIIWIDGRSDKTTFEIKNIFVDWGSSGSGSAFANASEYPLILGLEDQNVSQTQITNWGLSIIDTMVVDWGVSLFPTSYDLFRFAAKNPNHYGLPKGTSIKLNSSSGNLELYLPNK